MRKLVYLVATSIDGKICRADGSFDCFPMEGDHIADYLEMLKGFDAVLMGRNTYEVGLPFGVTDPYPHLDSYVLSSSMESSPDPKVKLIREDAAGFTGALKEQPGGNIYLCGGSRLAGSLFNAGLIDEIVLKLNPLAIGSGIPLFSGVENASPLRLLGTKIYTSGVVLLTYTPK